MQTDREDDDVSFREILFNHLKKADPALDATEVLDFEISLYDTQPPALVGLKGDFIAGARLDNLMSCYIGLAGLLASPGNLPALLVCNDHEEVGSASASGAQGPFLEAVLTRLLPAPEDRIRALDRSMMVSADDAHGIHPNYAAKYDGNHGPVLNRGPVIKINAGQRYATGSETAAVFRRIAGRLGYRFRISSCAATWPAAAPSAPSPPPGSASGPWTLGCRFSPCTPSVRPPGFVTDTIFSGCFTDFFRPRPSRSRAEIPPPRAVRSPGTGGPSLHRPHGVPIFHFADPHTGAARKGGHHARQSAHSRKKPLPAPACPQSSGLVSMV